MKNLMTVAFIHHILGLFSYIFSNFLNIMYIFIKLTQNSNMQSIKNLKIIFILILFSIFLNSCGGKLPGADARKYDPDPKKRVAKNLEEGRGFKVMDLTKNGGSGVFEFASSNELWRASLDIIDFMPLTSVNYSGGIIVTDWYSTDQSSNEKFDDCCIYTSYFRSIFLYF